MTEPTRHEAAEALADLAARERAVHAADRRTLPLLLGGWSALVLVDHIAKDHLRDRRSRAVVSAVCAAATLVLGALDTSTKPVQPVRVGAAPANDPLPGRLGAALLGWALAERVLVVGLRRSGVRNPNTLVGLALAAGRPAGYLGLRHMIVNARAHG